MFSFTWGYILAFVAELVVLTTLALAAALSLALIIISVPPTQLSVVFTNP